MASHDNKRSPAELPPEPGKWPAVGLAVLVHVLLLVALIFGVSWNNSSPGPVQAELWTALPAPNTPEPDQPQPQPQPVKPPEPVQPPPPAPPPPDLQAQKQADIAIEQEKKRREEEKQRQDEADQRKRDQQKRDDDKRAAEQQAQKAAEQQREADKQKADKLAADKKLADKVAADKAAADKATADKKTAADQKAAAERDRKLREAFRNDTAKTAGLDGGRVGGTADRNQAGGTGGDAGYEALVRSCIKPGVSWPGGDNASGGNPTAVFEVQLLPTGAQAGSPRLKSSSGVPAFDRAVENGIRRCDPFPRPASGRYASSIILQYRMFD